jgi:hypothetical protein
MEDLTNLRDLVYETFTDDFGEQFKTCREEVDNMSDYVLLRFMAHMLGELGVILNTDEIKKALDESEDWKKDKEGKKLWTGEIQESNIVSYDISCGHTF